MSPVCAKCGSSTLVVSLALLPALRNGGSIPTQCQNCKWTGAVGLEVAPTTQLATSEPLDVLRTHE